MSKNSQLIEDVYKDDHIGEIIDDLRSAGLDADRLAFGSYRQEVADKMKLSLELAHRKIGNLLKRFEP